MNTKHLKSPLVAMLASLIMCIILANSKNIHADGLKNTSVSHYSNDNHIITIRGNTGERIYIVDGKKFTFAELSDEDKKRIKDVEIKLNALEKTIDFQSDELELWSEKMEAVSEKMEEEAEKFEEMFEDFDIDYDELDVVSQKLEKARSKIELKMQKLEKQMELLEIKMRQIDQDKLNALEDIAYQYETILIDIADGI